MLRRLSFRHFATHKLRILSTVAGIALGVAALVGLRLVADAASRSFRNSIDRMAGKAVLQISNGDVGIPEELAEEVKQVRGVKIAAPSVQGYLGVEGLGGERIYVFGIDLLADQELREYQSGKSETEVEDPLVFLAQPDSVALTNEFLRRNRLEIGSAIGVHSLNGVKRLTVRASLDVKSGPATLLAGRIAVMDVFAAQRLFAYERRFSQIDVGIEPGADLAAIEQQIRRRVDGRGVVERPRARGETLEKLLAGTEATFAIAGMVAVVVALYVIFNTMMIAVAERRREIGVLRALGMRRREVLRLVLSEAFALGVVGSAIGVGAGYWLARASAASFLNSVSTRFMPIEAAPIVLHAPAVASGLAIGVSAALLAAVIPAREAVRRPPVEALGASTLRDLPAHYRRAAAIGAALMLGGVVVFYTRRWLPGSALLAAGSVGQNGFLIGASLVTPAVLRWIAVHGEGPFATAFGPLGSVAARSLVVRLRRVAITSAALLVAFANAIVLSSIISTLERTMNLMLDAEFGRLEIGIASGRGLTPTDVSPLPSSLAEEIATLPEIEAVDAERWVRLPYEGLLTYVVARDAEVYRTRLRNMVFLEGSEDAALGALARGEGVVVSGVFANRFGKHVGDTVSLPTPDGPVALRVVGVNLDMLDLGVVVIERGLYRKLWRDHTVSFIDPVPRTGANREQVMETIRRRWGDRYGLSLTTFAQIRKENDEVLRQSVAGAYPMIAISLVIALLGVVNSLFASVLDRVREIGLLRAVGATRGQVVRAIMLEATIVGVAGGVFGAVAGSLLGYMTAGTLLPDVFGIAAFYRYPTAAVVFALVAAVLLAAAAGYLPGRAAGRLEVAEALGYE